MEGPDESSSRTQTRAWARARVCALVIVCALGLLLARWLVVGEGAQRAALPWAWLLAGAGVLALAGVCAWWSARAGTKTAAGKAGSGPRALACALLLLGACAGACGWGLARWGQTPRDALGAVLREACAAGSCVARVEGVLLTEPRVRGRATGVFRGAVMETSWSAVLRVERVEAGGAWRRASGTLRLSVTAGSWQHGAGERVRVAGILEPREAFPRNPGDGAWLLRMRERSDEGVLRVSSGALVVDAPDAGGRGLADEATSRVVGAWAWARAGLSERARDVLERGLSDATPRARALAMGLMLGEREEAGEEAFGAFTRLGLAHVLSISGFHLAVMAMVALWAVRLTGDRGVLEPLLVGGLVLAYASIVPMGSPIVRSALMVLALLLCEALGRRYDRLCVLGWVALALLAWRPAELFTLGFQLSFGLTAVLLWTRESAPRLFFAEPALRDGVQGAGRDVAPLRRMWEGVKAGIGASAACWLVSAPLLAWSTGLVSPLGVLATLVVSPVVVVALWAGYAALLAGVIVPVLAGPGAWVLGVLSEVAVRGALLLDALPFSSAFTARPPVVLALGVTLAALLWSRLATRHRLAWAMVVVGVSLVLGLSLAVRDQRTGVVRDVALRVDALAPAMQEGAALLVRGQDGAMWWDCAGLPRRSVVPGIVHAARELGAPRTPAVWLSHADARRISGLPDLLAPLRVREVVAPASVLARAEESPRSAVGMAVRAAREAGVDIVPARAGGESRVGDLRLTVLRLREEGRAGVADGDANAQGLVVLVEAPTRDPQRPARALLTGDMPPDALRELAALLPTLEVDIAELPGTGEGALGAEAATALLAFSPRVVVHSGGGRAEAARAVIEGAGVTWLSTREGARWAEVTTDGAVRAR